MPAWRSCILHGELCIDERKLVPGDYNYGAPGASHQRVWSKTGCTCLLVTSTNDVLLVGSSVSEGLGWK